MRYHTGIVVSLLLLFILFPSVQAAQTSFMPLQPIVFSSFSQFPVLHMGQIDFSTINFTFVFRPFKTINITSVPSGGSLQGHVDIGPICPVERFPPDPMCQPNQATYDAWPIGVYRLDGSRIAHVVVDGNGDYRVNLPAGIYDVNLENPQTGMSRSNLPKRITVIPAKTTELNISIDTGIR